MKIHDQLPFLRIKHPRITSDRNYFDLRRYSYKYGASVDLNRFRSEENFFLELSKLDLLVDRIPLLIKLREHIEDELTRGICDGTIDSKMNIIGNFFKFIDTQNINISIDDNSIKNAYLEYTEHLWLRIKLKEIKHRTAYSKGTILGLILSKLINQNTIKYNLIVHTRLHSSKATKKAIGTAAEKQILSDTYVFGSFITDICSGINIESITGSLPLKIPIRNNNKSEISLNGNLKLNSVAESQIQGRKSTLRFYMKDMLNKREPSTDLSKSGRWYIFNLKVEAEFILFCSQTGQNINQALQLKRIKFKYRSHNDSYDVVSYKHRRGGETLFTIYKKYKKHFQKYLEFINYFFPDIDFLFPFFGYNGKLPNSPPKKIIYRTKEYCRAFQIPWVPPKILRHTRQNWLLRRSGDEDLTAEQAQHTKQVLRNNYEKPSQQRAMSEIIQFWNKFDKSSKLQLTVSVVGSECGGIPEPIDKMPLSTATPNCINPIGCIWCKQYRDIDSLDYAWSLASYRHLKIIEASKLTSQNKEAIDLTIDRLSKKMRWFSDNRSKWYEEVEQRIKEEFFHPNWQRLIDTLDLINVN